MQAKSGNFASPPSTGAHAMAISRRQTREDSPMSRGLLGISVLFLLAWIALVALGTDWVRCG